MFANGCARELDLVAVAMDTDQREVAGAAAHIAHQHELSIEEALLGLREMIRDPRIECRCRFFFEREFFQSGITRSLYGQLARFLIERRGNSEHDVLFR